MFESLMQDVEARFPGKIVLTMDDVAALLECPREFVYNLTRRDDPKMRPPMIHSGRLIRFPKRPFVQWLAQGNL